MKTSTKICVILTLMLLFICSTVFSQKTSSADVSSIATGIVERLDSDVVLTDSQKVVILEHAKTLAVKSQNTRSMANTDAVLLQRKSDVQEYKKALDAILTDEQKEALIKKRDERREAIVKKYTLSKELK
ncbi:MAG: hypothetical protein BGO29_03540 [Bacteroidales bacterium 36-12]|nr:MAG: hypothetical protein BGO29_03540 [Bacteroidales bacterium 36-12]